MNRKSLNSISILYESFIYIKAEEISREEFLKECYSYKLCSSHKFGK